jgi:hypothetical protein
MHTPSTAFFLRPPFFGCGVSSSLSILITKHFTSDLPSEVDSTTFFLRPGFAFDGGGDSKSSLSEPLSKRRLNECAYRHQGALPITFCSSCGLMTRLFWIWWLQMLSGEKRCIGQPDGGRPLFFAEKQSEYMREKYDIHFGVEISSSLSTTLGRPALGVASTVLSEKSNLQADLRGQTLQNQRILKSCRCAFASASSLHDESICVLCYRTSGRTRFAGFEVGAYSILY